MIESGGTTAPDKDATSAQRTIENIAQALRKGTSVELEIDVYGHLIIIEAKKQRISDKRF